MRSNKSTRGGLKMSIRKSKRKLKSIDKLKFRGRKIKSSRKNKGDFSKTNFRNRLMTFWLLSRGLSMQER
jgi:hypothetical protein